MTQTQDDNALSPYQLRIWKRNMPSIISQLRRECLVAYTMDRLPVICTLIMNEPIWSKK